jgi:hypothetical protein
LPSKYQTPLNSGQIFGDRERSLFRGFTEYFVALVIGLIVSFLSFSVKE